MLEQQLLDSSIRTDDLGKVYESGPIKYVALKGVNLNIRRGEFVAIVGPSGSGKTTLLNLLGTIDRPSSGEIYLDGQPVSRLKDNNLAEIRNKKLGFVFQSYNLIPGLTAQQNAELPLLPVNVSAKMRSDRSGAVLNELGLGEKLNSRPSELSGGEQQRVAIARALINDPSVILADEPTGNVDSKTADSVVSLLRKISDERKVTVVMVTHNMELTKRCERVIYLRDGQVEKEVSQAA